MIPLLLACKAPYPAESSGEGWSVQALEVSAGLSGLTVDGEGRLWSVSEDPAALVRLEDDHRIPLDLPAEPESIAWSPEGFWLGTERDVKRSHDLVLLVSPQGEVLRTLSYTYEGVTPQPNHGLEGLCLRGDTLIVAGEDARPGRDAPLAMASKREEPWRTGWLRLHSATGKVSGLACTETEIFAIERHYGVLHLLQAPFQDLQASRRIDVPNQVRGSKVNYEGLVVIDGKALLLSDNQGATVEGPTILTTLELPSR